MVFWGKLYHWGMLAIFAYAWVLMRPLDKINKNFAFNSNNLLNALNPSQ